MKNIQNEIKSISKCGSILSLAIFSLFLGGCNTMEGAGTDIKEAGKALESSAERNKPSSQPSPYGSRQTRSYKN